MNPSDKNKDNLKFEVTRIMRGNGLLGRPFGVQKSTDGTIYFGCVATGKWYIVKPGTGVAVVDKNRMLKQKKILEKYGIERD